ncbi:HD domain-containing protein [Pontiella sulfatireligans]|uniref:HD domain-containing protein n=1 Tax=Pontiella sulfatireligans TaxID=2750658 RepID=A0A6C2UKG2_9BACT|nr:HD domain-containing protein [Pontiella sulfatireligans]VGO19907.1 hypothetical protein SCARR_01967 [Pontiella sulfatireligans]
MNSLQLRGIANWFSGYVNSFSAKDGTLSPPLQLKEEHSKRVADNARQLAGDLGWSPEKGNAAEALGWLHDVGRFSQFSEFGTFSDANSINHGVRGWEVVRKSGILCAFAREEQEALLDGIRYHNVKTIPDSLAEQSMRFTQLVRDADKLDIYRIVLDSVELDGFQELPSMLPQIDLKRPANPKLIYDIVVCRCCSIEDVHSLADFLLMQLAWIYDLNYPETFRLIAERNIIGKLERQLPDDRKIHEIVHEIRRFANRKAALPEHVESSCLSNA